MPVAADTLRLQAELRRTLDQILDQHSAALLRGFVDAWDEVAPDLADTLEQLIAAADGRAVPRRVLLRSLRLQAALAHIAGRLEGLLSQSTVMAVGNLRRIVEEAGAQQAAIIASQLPAAANVDWAAWSRVDRRAVDVIVRRSTEQITAAHWPLSDEASRVVRRELIRGVAAGSNPRETARRMARRAEQGFNGGLSRAVTIARTEMVSAHREGAAVGQAPHADVLAGWVWLASMQPRTCRACLGMHGRVFPLSVPGPLGHQQCRCSRTPRAKSWAELGFVGLDEPDSDVPDAGEFFGRLAPDDQRRILGREGYAAWLAGRYPINAWARRRENPGWRDSFVPSTPPRRQRSGGRRGSSTADGS